MKKPFYLLFLCLFIRIFSPVASTHDSSANTRSISAQYAATPPVIDGDLSDDCWKDCAAQGDFRRRREPDRGALSSIASFLKITYDKENLYIAVEMLGDDPAKLLHSVTRRDEDIDRDDSVCLYFDTFHDHRSSYFLQVNPLGIQRDLYSTGAGQQVDIGWDAYWDAGVKMLAGGWCAEFRIPFKIFRFEWSDHLTWGFDAVRLSSQNKDSSEWAYVESNQNSTLDPNLYGHVTGLDGIDKPIFFQIIPSLTASNAKVNQKAFSGSNSDGWTTDSKLEAGADLVWGITCSKTLNLTMNPDYAQVEADPDQVNLTGQEIYLEERRTFFRENNAIFKPMSVIYPFYSRRVVDIDAGAKLTGQMAASDFALLLVKGDDDAGQDNLFSVLRTQTPFSDAFTVNSWLVGKDGQDALNDYTNDHGEFYENIDADYNVLAGIEMVYKRGNWRAVLDGYQTWYSMETRAWYTDESRTNGAYIQGEINYYGQNWNTRLRLIDCEDGFNPELGFVQQPLIDTRYASFVLNKNYYYPTGSIVESWYSTLYSEYNVDRNDSRDTLKAGIMLFTGVEFSNHFSIESEYLTYTDKTFERYGDFGKDEHGDIINPLAHYFFHTLGNGNNQQEHFYANFYWTDGGWRGLGIDYIDGTYYFSRVKKISAWARWKFFSKLGFENNLDYVYRFDPTEAYINYSGGWSNRKEWIVRNKITYSLNQDVYARLILSQYLDAIHVSDDYSLSFMIQYSYQPGSHMYLVYENSWTPYDFSTSERLEIPDIIPKSQTVYLKLTYLFDF